MVSALVNYVTNYVIRPAGAVATVVATMGAPPPRTVLFRFFNSVAGKFHIHKVGSDAGVSGIGYRRAAVTFPVVNRLGDKLPITRSILVHKNPYRHLAVGHDANKDAEKSIEITAVTVRSMMRLLYLNCQTTAFDFVLDFHLAHKKHFKWD